MKIERLPLNALRAFSEAARDESFKRAAERLDVTPGAVSRQIKQLETRLNVMLFERHPNGVIVTEAGRILLDDVRAGLNQIASGVEHVTKHSNSVFELSISAPPSFLQLWLLPRLHHFEQREPDINVSLEADADLTPSSWLPSRAKLSLRYGQGPWQGVESLRLFEDVLFPVCSPALATQGAIERPEDLFDHRLLAVKWERKTPSYLPNWNDWFTSTGLTPPLSLTTTQYSLYSLALDQAIAGQGLVLASYPLIAERLESGVLIRPFGKKYPLLSRFSYELILPENREAPEPVARFIKWLTQEAMTFRDDSSTG